MTGGISMILFGLFNLPSGKSTMSTWVVYDFLLRKIHLNIATMIGKMFQEHSPRLNETEFFKNYMKIIVCYHTIVLAEKYK